MVIPYRLFTKRNKKYSIYIIILLTGENSGYILITSYELTHFILIDVDYKILYMEEIVMRKKFLKGIVPVLLAVMLCVSAFAVGSRGFH